MIASEANPYGNSSRSSWRDDAGVVVARVENISSMSLSSAASGATSDSSKSKVERMIN